MQIEYWQERWKKNNIGFHEEEPNPLLVNYVEQLGLSQGDVILVPLCGKSVDIWWLLSQGFSVIGIEAVALAIKQFFTEREIPFTTEKHGEVEKWSPQDERLNVQFLVGDFFTVTPSLLPPIDAVYDRGALIALPPETRIRYTKHLSFISGYAKQLLLTLNYCQSEMVPPPFSIDHEELVEHYGEKHQLRHLEGELIEGGLRGVENITENVWLLSADKKGKTPSVS